jgi:hypothetical protein
VNDCFGDGAAHRHDFWWALERWRVLGTSSPQSCLFWLIGSMFMIIPAALATLV